MVGPAEVVTERLIGARPPSTARADYLALFTDPEVERWLRPPPLHAFTGAEIDRLLRHDRAHWQKHGYGPWAMRCRDEGRFVGRAGLAWTTVEGERMVELPWAVMPGLRSRGYAGEAARAAVGVAREVGLDRVVSLALPDNAASRRVMEKAGLTFRGEVEHVGLTHVLYELEL